MAIERGPRSYGAYIPIWHSYTPGLDPNYQERTPRSLGSQPQAAIRPPSSTSVALPQSKTMCLLVITSHSHCAHNTYRQSKCSEDAIYLQCPDKRTELGTFDGKCAACERWAALAWRAWEERIAWTNEKNMAGQAEQQRRRSTLWQDHHPLRNTAQSAGNSSPGTPSWCEW